MLRSLVLIIDMFTQVSLVLFAVSMVWMIVAVRRLKQRDIEPDPEWDFIPATDFFLLWTHKEYVARKRSAALAWFNLVCFLVMAAGFVLLPLLALFRS